MPTRQYEVRVSGLVPAQALLDFGDIEMASQELRTVLSGTFEDQAALYGFLHRLRAFGLDIVEVRRVPSGEDANVDEPRHDERTTDAESDPSSNL
ncbi:MAG TPA: hypothetical protein VJ820_13165 [Propionibacteriaceae bacterium]|nr:hypothetical protein [Propionibacteriaceae bacterium]